MKSQTVPYTPALLVETLVTFFGRAPEGLHQFLASADDAAIATIMRYFDEGFRFAREWMADMDEETARKQLRGERHLLQTDFMWVVGARDISCPARDLGWQVKEEGEGQQCAVLLLCCCAVVLLTCRFTAIQC